MIGNDQNTLQFISQDIDWIELHECVLMDHDPNNYNVCFFCLSLSDIYDPNGHGGVRKSAPRTGMNILRLAAPLPRAPMAKVF